MEASAGDASLKRTVFPAGRALVGALADLELHPAVPGPAVLGAVVGEGRRAPKPRASRRRASMPCAVSHATTASARRCERLRFAWAAPWLSVWPSTATRAISGCSSRTAATSWRAARSSPARSRPGPIPELDALLQDHDLRGLDAHGERAAVRRAILARLAALVGAGVRGVGDAVAVRVRGAPELRRRLGPRTRRCCGRGLGPRTRRCLRRDPRRRAARSASASALLTPASGQRSSTS